MTKIPAKMTANASHAVVKAVKKAVFLWTFAINVMSIITKKFVQEEGFYASKNQEKFFQKAVLPITAASGCAGVRRTPGILRKPWHYRKPFLYGILYTNLDISLPGSCG
jgi:hypothetical protein